MSDEPSQDYDDDFEQYEDDFEFEDDASENEFESGKDDGVLLEGGPSVSTQGISSDNRDNLPEGDRHISSATNEVSTTVATPHPPLDSNVPSNDLLHADGSPRYHVTKSESILHEAEARIKPSVTPKQVWSVHAQQGVQAESELEPTERALARRLEDSSADPSPLVSVHTAAGAPSKNPIHQHTPPVSDSAPETLQLEAPTPEEADDERAASTNPPLPASSPPVPEGVESADPSPSLHVLLERAPATPPESEPLYTPFSTEGSRSDVWGGTESGASTRRDDSGEDDEGPAANQQVRMPFKLLKATLRFRIAASDAGGICRFASSQEKRVHHNPVVEVRSTPPCPGNLKTANVRSKSTNPSTWGLLCLCAQ